MIWGICLRTNFDQSPYLLRLGKSYCGNYEYVLKFHSLANLSLRVDFLRLLPFSGGRKHYHSYLCQHSVSKTTFRKSKIVNCCFRILQCFHWISDEFNDIVMNFSKGVFTWEIARCFFWHLSRLLAKTEDLRVDTCAAKSRPFLVLTFKCLSETIWRRDLLVQVNRIWLCFSLFLFLSGEFLRFV